MANYYEENPKIKFISQCFVKPKHIIATNEAHIHLGACDLYMLSMGPMQKGLLFNTKPRNLLSHFLPKLEKSLYVSLLHFYALAGRLATQKFNDEHKCCFYIDCNKGPGARLVHAVVEHTVLDIQSCVDVHPIVNSLFDLGEESVNYDGHTRPLLSVQLTELVDGVFIGFTMNHCVADGTSCWHFISTLSEVFGQLKTGQENEDDFDQIIISKKPVLKTLFPSPMFKVPYLDPEEFIFRYDPGPLRVRSFHFEPEPISKIKAQANEECGLQNKISSFQALCGLTWRSIIRARHLEPDLTVDFTTMINARTRIDPTLPSEYFKCFIWGAHTESKVGELSGQGLGQAALLIHQSIKSQDNETIRTMIKQMEDQPFVVQPGPRSIFYRPNSVLVGGSARFDVYGPEFGLGKAVAVLDGYSNKEDGKITAKPGREGGGSVDLEICLKPETMNALELDDEFMWFASST